MKKIPNIFICLNNQSIVELIDTGKKHVVYAAPSISSDIAKAISFAKSREHSLKARVIIQSSSEAARLGYGDLTGLRILQQEGIETRSDGRIHTGILIVDEKAIIFSPTPEIILPQPDDPALNACRVPSNFAKWLLRAIAPEILLIENARKEAKRLGSFDWLQPQDGSNSERDNDNWDEYLEYEPLENKTESPSEYYPDRSALQPEIGNDLFGDNEISKICSDLENRPPRKFDQEREVQVYKSFLQFVDLKFQGARVATKTIRLPDSLLSIIKDRKVRLSITASCKLFENANFDLFELRYFERQVNEFRGKYIQQLSPSLGSIILTRDRASFENDLGELRIQLVEIIKKITAKLDVSIATNKKRIFDILIPLIKSNSLNDVDFDNLIPESGDEKIREYLEYRIGPKFPKGEKLIKDIGLECHFKDATWEMLNDPNFLDAIVKRFPEQEFTRLYQSSITIGERKKQKGTQLKLNDKWPDTLDNT